MAQRGRRAKSFTRRALAVCAAAACVVAAGASSPARAAQPIVIPSVGPLYDVLSTQWWNYVLAQPLATNPLFDDTGAMCRTGQFGPVFFLAGTANTGAAVRDQCTVPAGRALFFPLLNLVDVHTPSDDQNTPELIWRDLQTLFHAQTLYTTIDGVRIKHLQPVGDSAYRGCVGPVAGCFPRSFALTLRPGNVFGLDPGTYAPAVSDGFYLLLAPLLPGGHTLSFGGTGSSGTQNVTYHLRVVH